MERALTPQPSGVGAPVPVAGRTRRTRLQRLAVAISGMIALLYALTFMGVLSITGAGESDPAVLGIASAVFLTLAGLLWVVRSRVLWVAAAALQLLMGAMYLAVSPERDPSFEVWGLTLRGLSLVLLATLVGLLVQDARRRSVAR